MNKNFLLKYLQVAIFSFVCTLEVNGQVTRTFNNPSFEEPKLATATYEFLNQDLVPFWSTTALDNVMEIWNNGFVGVPSQDGNQFAEINARQVATLFQDICMTEEEQLSWSFWHRGRDGVDVINLTIGGVDQGNYSTDNDEWVNYSGTYTAGYSGSHIFEFEAVSTSTGSRGAGNFLDNIVITNLGAYIEFSTKTATGMEDSNINAPQLLVSGEITVPSTVTINIDAAEAIEGVDYTYDKVITIPIGIYDGTLATAVSINLVILDDAEVEPDETLTLQITSLTGDLIKSSTNTCGEIGIENSSYTIENNDIPICPNAPELTLENSTIASCAGNDGSAEVSAALGIPPYSFLWSDPLLQTSASAVNLDAGVFKVVVTDSQGCTDSVDVSVGLSESPILVLEELSVATCGKWNNASAQVNAIGGTSPYSFLWNDENSQNSELAEDLKEGVYEVSVTDAQLCTTSITVSIPLPECPFELLIPNVFTPNADDKNDVFVLNYGEVNPEEVRITDFKIYNRWGGLVYKFESSDSKWLLSWDGTKENGNIVTDGVYFYDISYTAPNYGIQETLHGTISIFR